MKHSTGKPTKAEAERMSKMKEQGICMACYQIGIKGNQYIEIHHLLSGNKRIGHMATVSLCPWHHDAKFSIDAMTLKNMVEVYGPSFHKHKRAFRSRYGSDAELLAMQNEMLHGE